MIVLRQANAETDKNALASCLTQLNETLGNMIHSLEKMTLHCSQSILS